MNQQQHVASGQPAESRRLPVSVGDHVWWLLLGGGLLLALVYVLLPYGEFASALYVAVSFMAALAIAVAVLRRRQLYSPVAWALIATALGMAAAGHAIWYWLDWQGLEPFPSLADAFYLAVYPLFMAALWRLGRHSDYEDGALSDALIVGVSAGVLGWAVLIAPYLDDPGLGMSQLIVSTAYPVADLILLPMILRLVFLQRTGIKAHLFLLLGMLAYLVADLLYAHGNLTGWYVPGGGTDGLWLVAYALFVAAVWHPSALIRPRSLVSSFELSSRRLYVLGVAAVAVPAVILFTADTDVEIVRVAALASIFLFLLIMHRMAGLIRQTRDQAESLERLSRTDPLTGAGNRRHLDAVLEREMASAERTGKSLSVAFVDLDYFKRFNDTHGHGAGDRLLEELASVWSDTLRPADTLARVGGEEFVVVMPNTTVENGRIAVERLRALVPYGQTCSAGIAEVQPGEQADEFLGRADQALYEAKRQGRNRSVMAEQVLRPASG